VFRRGPLAYVAERRRLALFPLLVARMPELRREALFSRIFLNRRSAAFDAALAGTAVAVLVGSIAPAAAAVPYLFYLSREAVGWRRWALAVIPARMAADAVGFGALAWGSVRRRSPVL
jgi:hypothetical protein